jgi:hypothetical protein
MPFHNFDFACFIEDDCMFLVCVKLRNTLLSTFLDVSAFLFNKLKAPVQWLWFLPWGHRIPYFSFGNNIRISKAGMHT